jgi:hypothetical protein
MGSNTAENPFALDLRVPTPDPVLDQPDLLLLDLDNHCTTGRRMRTLPKTSWQTSPELAPESRTKASFQAALLA